MRRAGIYAAALLLLAHCKGEVSGGSLPPQACAYAVERGLAPLSSTWQRVGPPGGRVSSLLPLGGAGLLVGTGFARGIIGPGSHGAGIYRSNDGGATLTPAITFIDAVGGVSVNALVRTDAGDIYAAVGSLSGTPFDGVYLSTNGGASFVPDSNGLATTRLLNVASAPGGRLYALVAGSTQCPLCEVRTLYRRDTGGAWLAAAMGGVDANGGPVNGMAVLGTRLFLAHASTLFASDDGGDSFSAAALPQPDLEVVRLLPDGARLVVVTAESGILATGDAGATWSTLYNPIGGALAPVPVEDLVLNGGQAIAATRGAGLQSATGGGFLPLGECLVSQVTRVAVAPDDATRVWAGTFGGGLYFSTDGGQSFAPQNTGPDELLAKTRVHAGALYLASAAGLFRSADGGNRFERLEPRQSCAVDLAPDPADANRLLVATDEDTFEGCANGQGVLSVALDTGALEAAGGLTGRNVAAVQFDGNRVYAYQRRGLNEGVRPDIGVFASDDGGRNFTLTTLVGAESAFESAPLAANGGLVFAGFFPGPPGPGSFRALTRSLDGGASSNQIYSASDAWNPKGVYVAPNGDLLLAGWYQNSGVRRSTNSGDTFVANDSGLSGTALLINELAFTGSGGLVAGGVAGVFYAADGFNFADLSSGLPAGVPVNSVAVLGNTVFAATAGGGVYRRALP